MKILKHLRVCWGKHFSSLNFRHSISITHHLSPIIHHLSLITHFFTLIWQHHFYFHHSIFSHYSWIPQLLLYQTTSGLLPVMMSKISPIGHTALTTQSEPAQQEQSKENLLRALVWCRPNTLRRSS